MAQEVSVSDYTKVNNRYDLFILGGDQKGVFTGLGEDYYYNGLNNKQVVSYLDFQQGELASKVLKPEKKDRAFFYSFYFQEQLHTLQYEDQSDKLQYPVYLESYNKNLTKIGEERAVGQLYPYIFTFNVGSYFKSFFSSQYGKMRRSYFFSHTISPAQDKVALLFNYNFFNSADHAFQCIVLDKDLQLSWSEMIDLPSSAGAYQMLENYAITDDGQLYLLVASFDNSNFKKSATGFEYHLYHYSVNAKKTEEINIPTNDRFIINLGLTLDQNQPVMAGIYADSRTNDILGGVRIQADHCQEFAFVKAEAQEINTKQDKNYAEEYTIRNIVLQEDGSAVFFAESYKRAPFLKPKLSLSGLSPIDVNVELGDIYRKILAVGISASEDHWLSIIDKNQRSSEPRDVYTSYAFTHDAEGYYLLFNDDIRSSSDVSLVKIGQAGNIALETLFDRKSYRFRLVSGLATSPASGFLALPVEKNGKQAILSINF